MCRKAVLTLLLFSFASSARASDTGAIRLTTSTPTAVEFEFTCGARGTDSRGITLPGTERTSLPGEPDLPGRIVLVGIPQEGKATLRSFTAETEELTGMEIPVTPALTEREPVPPGPMFHEDRFWPSSPAEILAIETVRGVRVARIKLNPVQFNPVQKRLKIHHRIRVTLDFSAPAHNSPRPDPLDPYLERILINGRAAVNWKTPGPEKDSLNFFQRFGVWCQVKTETTGIYRITPAELRNAGVEPRTIDPRTLRMFTIGRYPLNGPYPDTMVEIPIYVAGEDDGRFDEGDYILFYARASSFWNDSLTEWQTNYYTRYRTFWLTWNAGAGKRFTTENLSGVTAPKTRARNRVRVEQDLLCPARSGLLWVWERYQNTGPQSVTFIRELDLPNRDTLKSLKVCFYGWTDRSSSTYRAVLRLNGVLLDTVNIVATNQNCPPNTFVFDSLPSAAGARGNRDTLSITLLGAADIYLDFIEIEYIERLEFSRTTRTLEFFTPQPQEFLLSNAPAELFLVDVTEPLLPRRIIGEKNASGMLFRAPGFGVYFGATPAGFRTPVRVIMRQPGALRRPEERADYYIVCPQEFLPVARMFAQYRDGNIPGIPSARARAVAVEEIYDDYAFGMEEPGAIKTFFATKQPAYGLLAGDATYDYKDNLRLGRTPTVPAYEMGFDLDYEVYNPYVKALEAWYADFEGNGSSPDMILARITARTATELRQFLEKVKHYENQLPGLWANRLLLLADDEYLGDPSRKEGTIHIEGCERIAPLASPLLDLTKVYLTEFPLEAIKSKPRAEAELIRQLNQGALLWCFFGHGAGFQLCHERAFHIEDVPLVHNGSRNPVAFFGSCGVGRFEDTKYQSIAEELVRSPEGCIATIGASKATYSASNENFAQRLFSRLLTNPEEPLGPAFYEAWLTGNGTLYILFGDPATRIRLPEPGPPVFARPDTFYPGGTVNWRFSAPPGAGYYELHATEAERERYYFSDAANITYTLPGQEFFRGMGTVKDSFPSGAFVVPGTEYPDTVVVGNGRYVRRRNTCRISGIVITGTTAQTIRSDSIYLSTQPASNTDTLPPRIHLRADNVPLKLRDTTRVPKRFTLQATVFDSSGVFLLPDPVYGISLYLGSPSNRTDLIDRFTYEDNSSTTGRFTCPLNLEQNLDSLYLTVADNYLNRSTGVYYLATDLREDLTIDRGLVYPNPVIKDRAFFTFLLSSPARVTVKIYTISGRLIRTLGPQECAFGYNQIEWDAKDAAGTPLPNGVYLYKIDARSGQTLTGDQLQTRVAVFRDRLIIRR